MINKYKMEHWRRSVLRAEKCVLPLAQRNRIALEGFSYEQLGVGLFRLTREYQGVLYQIPVEFEWDIPLKYLEEQLCAAREWCEQITVLRQTSPTVKAKYPKWP